MQKSRFYSLCVLACLAAAGCSDSSTENSLGKGCTDACDNGYVCKDQVCKKELNKGDNCGFKYTYCTGDLTCVNGVCGESSSETPTKIEEGDLGSACKENADCVRGTCQDGKCTGSVELGQSCDEDRGIVCADGAKCVEHVCKTGAKTGENCGSSLVYCETGSCSQGKCIESVVTDCTDSDGDGISDEYECHPNNPKMDDNCEDADGDGKPNYLDLDSDGDTIPDEKERLSDKCADPADSDGDGKPDFLDDDSDDNGIPDSVEGFCHYVVGNCKKLGDFADTDGDGIIDSSDDDNDGDNALDTDEIPGFVHDAYKNYSEQAPRGADCYNAELDKWGWYTDSNGQKKFGDGIPDPMGSSDKPFDCDGDTIPDYMSTDSDGDGIPDVNEDSEGWGVDTDGDGYYNRYDVDSDNDGLLDTVERGDGAFPARSDYVNDKGETKQSEIDDYVNPDIDGDGLVDGEEVLCKLGVCNDVTVSLNTDSNNCGECGKVCDEGTICLSGKCSVLCSNKGEEACNGTCVATESYKTDVKNCGSCGNACEVGWDCEEGSCILNCAEGLTNCKGVCVDLNSANKDNCGGCGVSCTSDQVCGHADESDAWSCIASTETCTCELDENGNKADENCVDETSCWGSCVDIQSDDDNCGGCGIVCGDGRTCKAGTCACPDETSDCSGKCISLSEDVNNCGACGVQCTSDKVCVYDGESISSSCVAAEINCSCELNDDGTKKDESCVEKTACWGTCIDVQTDVNNCGTCGNVCADGIECKAGVCDVPVAPVSGEVKDVDSRYYYDADGDGVDDVTEYTAAMAYAASQGKPFSSEYAEMFICDPKKGAVSDPEKGTEGVFDFYFTLPYLGKDEIVEAELKQDVLNFKPAVSKLDVVFNLDTTNSMGDDVKNLQDKVATTIIPSIRDIVSESAFGVSRFDDFPTHPTLNSEYDFLKGNGIADGGYGRADDCSTKDLMSDTVARKCDVPFQLLGRPEVETTTVQTNVNNLSLHHGGDYPEAGYEALWQIVMGDDRNYAQTNWYQYGAYSSFKSGSIEYAAKSADRWGGAQFRNSTLPVVIHVTDTTAHDNDGQYCDDVDDNGNKTCKPYDPAYVENAHYSAEVLKAYQDKGARIISVYDEHISSGVAKQHKQLMHMSNETNAYVPVCAFQKLNDEGKKVWECGVHKDTEATNNEDGRCCTVDNSNILPVDGQCVLSYAIKNGKELSDTLVKGVDALVKYATSEVAAIVKRDEAEYAKSGIDTSCFLKFVESSEAGYIAPPQEPEKSCNPVAKPGSFNGAEYTNGYTNFAIGTSSKDKEGAQLNFTVKAENNNCAPATEEAQIFEAYIELIDPKTGMSFGKRTVSIVVPGVRQGGVN